MRWSVSAPSWSVSRPTAAFILSAAMPLWLLCASSMMIAKLVCLISAMPPTIYGNFWMVVEIILFPFSIASFKSEDLSAWTTIPLEFEKAFTFSVNWRSSNLRSVTIITVWNNCSLSAFALVALIVAGVAFISLKASHAIEFDFPDPAECWMRYLPPTPFSCTSSISRLTTSSWWKRGKINFFAFFNMWATFLPLCASP